MKLFGINPNASYIFVMSMLSGSPSNSKYATTLLEKNLISLDDASKSLMFSHFTNPIFILNMVGGLYSKKIAFTILIIHYITNIIIGILFRKYNNSYIKKKVDFKKIIYDKNDTFINTLIHSTKDSLNILLLILGTISIFNLLSSLLAITLNNYIITGFIEMSSGIKLVNFIKGSNRIKLTLIGMYLSFGGLSIHTQIISIIKEFNIKYMPYLYARIIHMVITGILVYLIFPII